MLFDLLTSNKILEISEKYLGEKFERLNAIGYIQLALDQKSMAY